MSALRDAMRELPDAVFADLLESDDAYLLVIDLPGANAETVDVGVTDGRLEIEARREKDVPMDFSYLQEERSLFLDADLPLPPDATGADAEATIDRGVLELRLPKREATPEQEIHVESR
jgi:HSP20 family molecular chaperone IbpA